MQFSVTSWRKPEITQIFVNNQCVIQCNRSTTDKVLGNPQILTKNVNKMGQYIGYSFPARQPMNRLREGFVCQLYCVLYVSEII